MKTTTRIILLFAGLLAGLALPAAADSIKGNVTVKGLRSPADILVYLSKAPGAGSTLPGKPFVMDQRNLSFLPHLLPVPVGATVQFPNNDKVDHNVFSLSRSQAFNLGSYTPGEVKTVTFDTPGIVELRCDVHAEMLAYIVVLENPYFAVTDENGSFQLPDPGFLRAAGIADVAPLPPGRYLVKTWHAKLKSARQAVEVSAGAAAPVALDLTRGTPGVLYK